MKKWLLLLLCIKGFSQEAVNFSLYYDTDVYTLKERQKTIINSRLLNLNPKDFIGVEIKAYADYVDSKNYNKELSAYRAEMVYQYLSTIIDTNRVKVNKKAYGEVYSAEKDDLNGNPQDRRVDLTIHFKNPQKIEKDSLFLDFPVSEIKVGTKIVIKDLYFFRGRTKMYDYSSNVLDSIGAFLKRNKKFKLEIHGHVCCGGSDPGDVMNVDTKTKTLSIDRAKTIYNYLVQKAGISPKRLSHRGFGFSDPKSWPENTNEDEKNNRRVELMVVDF